MNNSEFMAIVTEQLDYCKALLNVKGDEYDAATADRFHSFKTAAELQQIAPKQALAGMMCKHTVSIYDMCNGGEYSDDLWREKITDSINYLLLLLAMVLEENSSDGGSYEKY